MLACCAKFLYTNFASSRRISRGRLCEGAFDSFPRENRRQASKPQRSHTHTRAHKGEGNAFFEARLCMGDVGIHSIASFTSDNGQPLIGYAGEGGVASILETRKWTMVGRWRSAAK